MQISPISETKDAVARLNGGAAVLIPGPSGGIGRRGRLKPGFRKECRLNACLGYQSGHPMPVLFWIGIWTIFYGLTHGVTPAAAVEAPRAVLPAVPQVPVSPAEVQMPGRAKRRRDARGRFAK